MAPGVEEEVKVAAQTVIWKGEQAQPRRCSPTPGTVSCPTIAPEAPRGRGVSPGGSSRLRAPTLAFQDVSHLPVPGSPGLVPAPRAILRGATGA